MENLGAWGLGETAWFQITALPPLNNCVLLVKLIKLSCLGFLTCQMEQ